MNIEWISEALSNLSDDLEIVINPSHQIEEGAKDQSISEEDLLLAIATRVASLMDRDPGLLFSYMYRLDISEANLNMVIKTPSKDPIAYRIAELILNRQKARILSKKKYSQENPLEGWEW